MDPMLIRSLAFIFAALAGWSLGRATPTWEADVESVETRYSHRWGNRLVSGTGASCTTGTGAFVGWVLAALIMQQLGWPSLDGSALELDFISKLFQTSTLLLLLVMTATYVVARLTDKGPAGPLE